MQMAYGLAAVLTAVCYDTVAVDGASGFGDLQYLFKYLRHDRAVFTRDRVGGIDVRLRYDEHMAGSFRCDITEREYIAVLVDLVRGYLSLDNAAE